MQQYYIFCIDRRMTVVFCFDYELKDCKGRQYKDAIFNTQEEAIQFLNSNFKKEFIDPDFLSDELFFEEYMK